MFAGPNGSGKSYLIDEIRREVNLVYLINADVVEEILNKSKFLDCADFIPCDLDQETWNDYLSKPQIQKRIDKHFFPTIQIEENILVHRELNMYH